jgi:2-oxoglutarate dehydrogenase E2 component (dihydrolipoamide succinyltransferase)
MKRTLFLAALTAAAGLPLAYVLAWRLGLLPGGQMLVAMGVSLGSGALVLLAFCPPRSASPGAWLAQVGALLAGPAGPPAAGEAPPPARPAAASPARPAEAPAAPAPPPAAPLPRRTAELGPSPSVVVAAPTPRPPPFEPTAPLLPGAEADARTVRNLPPYPRPEGQEDVMLPLRLARPAVAPVPPAPEGSEARTVRHLPTAGPPPPAIPPVKLAEAAAVVPRRPLVTPAPYQATYQAQEAAAPTRDALPPPAPAKKGE